MHSTGSALVIGTFSLDWMVVALIVIVGVISFAFWSAQKNKTNPLDLCDLVMEDGKLSKVACVMMGAFAVTTWMMVQLTLNGKMSEAYLGTYGALWISPIVTRIIKGPSPRDQGATQ